MSKSKASTDAITESVNSDKQEDGLKGTQASILLELVAESGMEFFHTDKKVPHAIIPIDNYRKVLRLESKEFNIWLKKLFYDATNRAVNTEAIKQAVGVMTAKALFDNSEPVTLYTRIGKKDGRFYYDLCNDKWDSVEIMPSGWKIRSIAPLFERLNHQKEQVVPIHDGDIGLLYKYLNVKRHKTLLLCVLISYLIPDIPRPMLVFYGDKGSGKTTIGEISKIILDPSCLSSLSLSNDVRSITVNLQQHSFALFDNISSINSEISDMLCRAITGSGIQQRKLHTNAEDYIFTFTRAIGVNGINIVANRADLLDRSILIECERIPEKNRREIVEFKDELQRDLPSILGGIFDVLSKAMHIYPSVKLESLPRMADFTRWGYAIAEAMGGLGKNFLSEYAENRARQNYEAINADIVGTLIVEFMHDKDIWEGSPAKLIFAITDIASKRGINPSTKGFPTHPNHLTRSINRIKSNLEDIGIMYSNKHKSNGTLITFKRM